MQIVPIKHLDGTVSCYKILASEKDTRLVQRRYSFLGFPLSTDLTPEFYDWARENDVSYGVSRHGEDLEIVMKNEDDAFAFKIWFA